MRTPAAVNLIIPTGVLGIKASRVPSGSPLPRVLSAGHAALASVGALARTGAAFALWLLAAGLSLLLAGAAARGTAAATRQVAKA